MKLILKNRSADSFSYLSGTVVLSPNGEVDVPSKYWVALYDDVNFLRDLRFNNFVVSDGVKIYEIPDSEFYIKFIAETVRYKGTTVQPFAEKILTNGKRLFMKVHGISAQVSGPADNIDFIVPYPECKLTGIEIINGEDGDKVSFQVLDTSQGTYSGTPNSVLNQFGYDVNIVGAFYDRASSYDADLMQNMVLRLIYDASNGDLNPKTVYINFIIHEVKV